MIGRVLLLWCIAALGFVLTDTVHANGDPPSDVLLVTDVYRPYLPPVRPAVLKALSSTVADARSHGHPVKVALIASVIDLGNVPNLDDACRERLTKSVRAVRENDEGLQRGEVAGSRTSTTRTADQTDAASWWQARGAFWNGAADEQGAKLGKEVAHYLHVHYFQSTH